MINIKKDSIRQEVATLELINKHFWKSKIGPLSSLGLSICLMIIYRILGQESIELFKGGLAAYLSFSILPLCFISLPQMIVEFKTSIILRKISTSKITSLKFSALIFSYNFLATIISTLIIFLLCAIFLNVEAPDFFNSIKWGQLIYSLFNIYISCLSFGLLIGVLVNRINLIQIIAFTLIIISITFSGQFIPLSVLSKSETLKYITLFSPVSYSLNMMNVVLENDNKEVIDILYKLKSPATNFVSFTDSAITTYNQEVENYKFSGIFDVSNTYKVFSFKYHEINPEQNPNSWLPFASIDDIFKEGLPIEVTKITTSIIYKSWQLIMNIVMPYIFSILFIFISIKKFKWTSR